MCADLARGGDEPLMLARAVQGARVLVSSDRFLAGRLAEVHLEATVHLLDDGFQHLPLARGTDLLIVSPEDLADARTLPSGRLRESLAAASFAHAVLAPADTVEQARTVAASLGVGDGFRLVRVTGAPRRLDVVGASAPVQAAGPVLAIAGIAQPERFFQELARGRLGCERDRVLPGPLPLHGADAASLVARARRAGARAIVTTEKDLVRLLPFRPMALPVVWVPLEVRIEPAAEFRTWLASRLAAERARGVEVRA